MQRGRTQTMKFTSKIWEAAATDNTRRCSMDAVRFEAKPEPRMIATNGSILAIVPVTLDEGETVPDDALLDTGALKAAHKAKGGRRWEGASLHLNGKATATDAAGAPSFEFKTGEFPRIDAVIPPEGKGAVRVTLSASLLYDLAVAMGANEERVTLEIQA